MNALLHALSSPAWTRLVTALAHSLWLGVCWVAVLAAALRVAGSNPDKRYRRALGALGGFVLSIFLVWSLEDDSMQRSRIPPAPVLRAPAAAALVGGLPSPAAATPANGPVAHPRPWTGLMALFWASGASVMLLRLFGRILASNRLRQASMPITEPRLVALLAELRERLGWSRTVRLAANQLITAPAVTGILIPTILVPTALFAGIPEGQLRAILLHELAHIRRHDFLVNILQQFIEAALFFNPAVWWIGRQIRVEREVCCDRIAVAACSEKDYAAALAEFAQHARFSDLPLEAAFPGPRGPSTLLERVRRLLVAEYQPAVRLPWHSSLAVLACAALLLTGAWRGTRVAVTFAADYLSAQKRIQEIARLKTSVDAPERSSSEADKIQIAGEVHTEDGAPLPERTYIHLTVQNLRSSVAFGPLPVKNGRFQRTVGPGDLFLAASASEGYGPVFVGPLRSGPEGSLTNIVLVLPKGYESRIQVIDPAGKGIAGVQLEGIYQNPVSLFPILQKTDSEGFIRLPHSVDAPMRWTASARGFQDQPTENVRLLPHTTYPWRLLPARTTTVQVVRKTDGLPIAQAAVRFLVTAGGSVLADASNHPPATTTDEHGVFKLSSLAEGARQILLIARDGYAPKVLADVAAGQNLKVELSPEIQIGGVIQGDLARLTNSPEPEVYFAQVVRQGSSCTYLEPKRIPVSFANGQAAFRVAGAWEADAAITVAGKTYELALGESKTNLVLQIPTVADRRQIVVRFRTPTNAPPVTGQLEVSSESARTSLPIANNETRFEAPIGSFPSWFTRGIIGYWAPENPSFQVQAGDGPQVIEIPVLPAGAIHGRARAEDGSEASGLLITVVEAKPAPGKQPGPLGEVGKNTASANEKAAGFIAQPLPLGGEYMLMASRGPQYAASAVIALSAEKPIQEAELRFVPGQTISGQVVDEQGRGLANLPLLLDYQTPYSHSFRIWGDSSLQGPRTDAEGRFAFSNLNERLPGSYQIAIKTRGRQPVEQKARFSKPLKITLLPGERLSVRAINDRTGKPVRGASFYAMAADFKAGDPGNLIDADSPSGADGLVEFSQLARREYNLYCRAGEIADADRHVPIPRPPQDPLTIRIKPYPGLRLGDEDGF